MANYHHAEKQKCRGVLRRFLAKALVAAISAAGSSRLSSIARPAPQQRSAPQPRERALPARGRMLVDGAQKGQEPIHNFRNRGTETRDSHGTATYFRVIGLRCFCSVSKPIGGLRRWRSSSCINCLNASKRERELVVALAVQGVELAAKVGVIGEHPPQADEDADDLDAHGDRARGLQNGREHRDALFRERQRAVAAAAMLPAQT
jgi:hypothetical protein